jgi:hypothetical protein
MAEAAVRPIVRLERRANAHFEENDMSKGLFRFIVWSAGATAIAFLVLATLAAAFQWSVSLATALNALGGVVCLVGLIIIVKVPWDVFFEARATLFEMQRSEERDIAVNPERRRYVKRLERLTGAFAVASHGIAAGIIAVVTYASGGEVGYYFAGFYVIATFFRPIGEAHRFLRAKLSEIRNEVCYPRDDVTSLQERVTTLVANMDAVLERLDRMEDRFLRNEAAWRTADSSIANLRLALQRAEESFQSRMGLLSDEVEKAFIKAYDQQDIINGLRAFAKLVKSA